MASTARATVMAILLAGCGATGSPATGAPGAGTPATPPAPRVAKAASRPAELRAPAPGATGGTTAAASPAAGDATGAEPTAACLAAFDDQRQLYVGVEVEVHPERRAAFLRSCATMPPAYQRCASPLHQIGNEEECRAVHDDEDRAAKAAWYRTFELLSDPRPDLPPASVELRAPRR